MEIGQSLNDRHRQDRPSPSQELNQCPYATTEVGRGQDLKRVESERKGPFRWTASLGKSKRTSLRERSETQVRDTRHSEANNRPQHRSIKEERDTRCEPTQSDKRLRKTRNYLGKYLPSIHEAGNSFSSPGWASIGPLMSIIITRLSINLNIMSVITVISQELVCVVMGWLLVVDWLLVVIPRKLPLSSAVRLLINLAPVVIPSRRSSLRILSTIVPVCPLLLKRECPHGITRLTGRPCVNFHTTWCKKQMRNGLDGKRCCTKGDKCRDIHVSLCKNKIPLTPNL